MTRIVTCLLALLFSMSSPAVERNTDLWRSTLAAKTRVGYHATYPEAAQGIRKAGSDATEHIIKMECKDVKLLSKELEHAAAESSIHRGARAYQGESHVYSIRAPDGSYYKIGKSSQGVRVSDEASIRAEQQVRRLNAQDMEAGGVGGYESEIRKAFGSSGEALDYESALRDRYRRMFGEDLLPGNREHLRGKGGSQ